MPTTLDLPAAELVNELRARGVTLQINGSKLRVSSQTALTDADRVTIRERKAELFTLLTVPNAGGARPPLENDAPDSLPDWVFAAIDAAFPLGDAGAKTSTADMPDRYRREWTPWAGDDTALIGWFQSHRDQLPTEPFELSPCATIGDPAKFYAALERDAEAGSNGPRAAGLLNELRRLRELL